MKKAYIPFIVVLIFVIIHYFSSGGDLQQKAKDNFTRFNTSDLKDELLGVDYYAKGMKISFKHDHYVFYPITSPLNDNNIFMGVAEVGDSIYKKPNQKILILKKKNGKEYKFSFREF